MYAESRFLVALAERITAANVAQTKPSAILLTGSAAQGLADAYSDLDLIVYYEALPSPAQVVAARDALQATDVRPISEPEAESFLDQFVVQGVTCQVAHLTVAAWERDMASVLEAHEPGTLVEKALAGLLEGVPLHGAGVITAWQARAADYPAELVRATVEHYLRFFPLWYVAEGLRTRDATIFSYQMLVEASLNLLGVLAGLNRRYFSTFQFKRLHHFAGTLSLAPERLAERLDAVFALDPVAAGLAMEGLVGETLALVEAHMPEVDTGPARRLLGQRPQPWRAPSAGP
jgi:predicted nucleotidyltransferase